MYFSHETYTPARGGCSEAEAVALRHAFGEASGQIEVTNTKGMTGHTMGAAMGAFLGLCILLFFVAARNDRKAIETKARR